MEMAQKVRTLFIDDIDGSEAEGTVGFGLDGAHYEIDLSQVHARELRAILARYAGAGRKGARPASGARPPRAARAPRRYATGRGPTGWRSRTAAGSQPT